MKGLFILAGAAALLAGCNRDSGKQTAEALVRSALSRQGNVQQVDLSRQGDNNYAGTATLRRPDGQVVRLNCTATRTGANANTDLHANCGQVLDQTLVEEIKTTLRRAIEGTGATVVQLEMTRRDENNVTGSAQARNPDGRIVQMTCDATRQSDGIFNSRCRPVSGAAEPAQAEGEAEAPADGGQ